MITINNTIPGLIKNIEVKGNTYQDPNNLTKIISSGIDNGDGTYKMSILSCGENLIASQDIVLNKYYDSNGNMVISDNDVCDANYHKINSSSVTLSRKNGAIQKPIKILTYDKDKKFIQRFQSSVLSQNVFSVSFGSDVKYIRIGYSINDYDLKLQEGTVATPYTPYQETRCDIKLPCQLEKWDRLYFDKEENAWCIDKNMDNGILNGKEPWIFRKTDVNTIMIDSGTTVIFPNSASKNNNSKNYFCNKLKSYSASELWSLDSEGIDIKQDGIIHIRLSKEKATDLESAKKWISENNFYLKYLSTTPKKIVLPQSEQIKLNSFANKTHIYTISGDVDAIVKATVSKSLASTVQANTHEINILNDKIADIQGLKESQDFAYETDKGYLVCKDTQNGVVKDLKISGKSLVNYGEPSNIYETTSDRLVVKLKNKDILTNSQITFVNFSDKMMNLIIFDSVTNSYKKAIDVKVGVTKVDISNTEKIDNVVGLYSNGWKISDKDTIRSKYVMLIGDYTQNPPNGYFEGIASVGNGNEIEVLSSNQLWNGSKIKKQDENWNVAFNENLENGFNITSQHHNTGTALYYETYLKKGVEYVIKCSDIENIANIRLYGSLSDMTNNINSQAIATITTEKNIEVPIIPNQDNMLLRFWIKDSINKVATVKNINIYEYGEECEYKQDKKPILFKDTDNTWKPVTELRGIDLNSCDTIENGKLKNRIKKTLLNGVENYVSDAVVNQVKTIAFALNITDRKVDVNRDNIISDKFKTLGVNFTSDEEGIFGYGGGSGFVIRINRDRLETQDIQGFKKWLQLNNVTIIYELSQEIVYEVNPLDLESYDNETMILFGSGVIAPYASWKITSHAANIIKNQGQRLTRLENDFYKYTVIQNRIMLDSRYAADNATFKIDTSIYSSNNVTASNLHASICEVKETHQDIKYDFDLYKLIKRNILVGKDNYDRAWMEECITFYWMDFKISDQMHAELNEIIENQYNPPVDMTPIEPPMEDVVEEIPQA